MNTDSLKKAIGLATNASELLQKSHVKGYQRTTASGATVQVKEHDDSRQKAIASAAQKHLHVDDLTEKKSDREDFHEISTWGMKHAMYDAYTAGKGGKNMVGPSQGMKLQELAKHHFGRDFTEHGSDSHDFHEHHVNTIKDALGAAYDHGQKTAAKRKDESAKEHDQHAAFADAKELSRKAFATDKYADHQKALEAHKAGHEKATDATVKEKHQNYITMHTAESHVAKDKPKDEPAKPATPKKAEKPLPTNNETWGYHGESYTHHEGHVPEQEQGTGASEHFELASKAVMKHGGVGAIDARNYLDSRNGRHLHDEVINHTYEHEGRPADEEKGHHPDVIKRHIEPAIQEHFKKKWAQKALDETVKNRSSFE